MMKMLLQAGRVLAGLLVMGFVQILAAQVNIAGILETRTIPTQIDSVTWFVPDPVTEITPDWGGQIQMSDTYQFSPLPQWPDMVMIMYNVNGVATLFTIGAPEPDVWYELPPPDGNNQASQVMFKDTLLQAVRSSPIPSFAPPVLVNPDPFLSKTTIRWHLESDGPVELAVYSPSGRRLFTHTISAGSHSFVWNGRDRTGHRLPPGVYFIRLSSGAAQATASVTLGR